jgi:hypothetical protein
MSRRILLAVLALWVGGARACAPSENSIITIGENTYVCVVINWMSYLVAVPKADEYSRIAIKGSYNDNNSTFAYGYNRQNCTAADKYDFGADASLGLCQYTTVTIESHGAKSLTKAYKIYQGGEYTPTSAPVYVFPIMTAVISVYNGEVQSITWDDGCYFCDTLTANADGVNEYCQPNIFSAPNISALPAGSLTDAQTAAAKQAKPYTADQLTQAKVDGGGKSCITYGAGASSQNPSVTGTPALNCAETPEECDLKLYVVWTGTDANGNYFQSAGLRFSRFQQFAISSLYTSARTLTLDAYDAAADTVESGVDAVKSRL